MDTTKSKVYLTMEKETLVKIIDNKRDCIKMLKERIDKAIEYIEQKKLQPRLRTANTYSLQERQLLDILKGSDSNEIK